MAKSWACSPFQIISPFTIFYSSLLYLRNFHGTCLQDGDPGLQDLHGDVNYADQPEKGI